MDSNRGHGKGVTKIRTYAQDLENERRKRNLPTPKSAPEPTTPSTPVVVKPGPAITATTPKTPPPPPKVIPIPRPKEAAPTQIPPFHTLAKKPAPPPLPRQTTKDEEVEGMMVVAPLIKKQSLHTPSTKSVVMEDTSEISDGTIITDTKHVPMRFFPSVMNSFTQWFTDLQTAYKERNAPKYTIPETERRKGVIQRATSKTGTVATADHALIRDRIKNRKRTVTHVGPTTTWTPNTETVFPLLEAPESVKPIAPSNIQVVLKKRAATIPPPPAPPVQVPVPAKKPELPTPVYVEPDPETEPVITSPARTPIAPIMVSVAPPPPAPIITTKEVAPVSKSAEPIELPPTEPDPSALRSGYLNAETAEVSDTAQDAAPDRYLETTDETPWWKYSLRELDTNVLATGIVTTVAICVVAIIGIRQLFIEEPLAPVAYTTPETLLTDTPLITKDDRFVSKAELFTLVQTELEQNESPTIQIAFIEDTQTGTIQNPASILNSLGDNLNQGFVRSISQITFGGYERTSPFIIIRITDPITARGGMLEWERTLEGDLYPLFSTPPTSTSTITFVDRRINTIATRSLRDESGTEYLVYGFLNEEHLLITKNQETFAKLQLLASTSN